MKTPFTRPPLTLLGYVLIAFFAFFEASLGPIVPFLQEQMNLSNSLAGAHMSFFAVGMIIGGNLAPRLTRRWGRPLILTISLGIFGTGIFVLTLAMHPLMSLGASSLFGFGGSIAFVLAQALLSQSQGENQARALTEANLGASLATTSLPLLIGLSLWAGLTWRGAFWGSVILFSLAIIILTRFTVIPPREDAHRQEETKQPLPVRFWIVIIILYLGVSAEWAVVFWAASYMTTYLSVPEGTASTLVSLLFGGMVLSRFIMSRLAGKDRTTPLLVLSVFLTMAGLPLFMIKTLPLINAFGLILLGIGIANFYPLTLVLGFVVVPGQSDRISGYISSTAGLSILTAPLILGLIADATSLRWAYGTITIFLVLILGLLAEVKRRQRRQTRTT